MQERVMKRLNSFLIEEPIFHLSWMKRVRSSCWDHYRNIDVLKVSMMKTSIFFTTAKLRYLLIWKMMIKDRLDLATDETFLDEMEGYTIVHRGIEPNHVKM